MFGSHDTERWRTVLFGNGVRGGACSGKTSDALEQGRSSVLSCAVANILASGSLLDSGALFCASCGGTATATFAVKVSVATHRFLP